MQTGEAGDVLKKRNLRTLPGPLWIYHTGLKRFDRGCSRSSWI